MSVPTFFGTVYVLLCFLSASLLFQALVGLIFTAMPVNDSEACPLFCQKDTYFGYKYTSKVTSKSPCEMKGNFQACWMLD